MKPTIKVYNSDEEDSEEDRYNYNYDKYQFREQYKLNKLRNSEDNYLNYLSKIHSTGKKKKIVPDNKIIVTEDAYVINYNNGQKRTELTKKDLGKFICIKDEKYKLVRKKETKDDHLMRYLKKEIDNAKKMQEVKVKLKEKDEKIKNFLTIKNKAIKNLENGRYQDRQDIHERKQIYEKLLSNYDEQIYCTKEQQKQQNKTLSLNKISAETNKKMEELKKQIQDYEKKNDQYKKEITKIFDLPKDKMKKKIEERMKNKKDININPKVKETSSSLMLKKINNLEEQFEIEKYRRENALMESMNNFQKKINLLLIENEKKAKKRQEAIEKIEKEKAEKKILRTNVLNRVKNNQKENEKKNEDNRQKLMDKIEKNNLKDYAIKQEKNKIIEETRNMNVLNRNEREALKLKIQNIIKKDKNFAEGKMTQEIINKLINEKNNSNLNEEEE